MRHRTNYLQDQGFSPPLTYAVDTDTYQSILETKKKQVFVLGWAQGSIEFAKYHFGLLAAPSLFQNLMDSIPFHFLPFV